METAVGALPLTGIPAAAIAAIAAVVTLVSCWPLRWLALSSGILDRPGAHKSHTEPVPYLGGVAIWLGAAVATAAFQPSLGRWLALVAMALALGVIDDVFGVGVAQKLAAQCAIALAAIGLGCIWRITDSYLLNAIVSVVWIVGLTNSFNLLDNMDGLAATVAVPGLLLLAAVSPGQAVFSLALAGGALGFLVVNLPPARMFMGDAGSLAIGFALATATIAAANQAHGLHSLVLLAGPVAVAIFDTSLVIVSRLLNGRPIQLGGRDHYSHRLRLRGWSCPQVLAASATAAGLGSLAAYFAESYPVAIAWLAVPLLAAGVLAWLELLKIDPYAEARPAVVEVRSA